MMSKKEAIEHNVNIIETDNNLTDAKAERIAKIKELLPNVINSDNQIDLKALHDLVGIENTTSNNQGYELTFAGKGLARAEADRETTKELKAEIEQSKNFDETDNVIIRGDNIDSLKILYKNYHNSIKMIYIDPPYNTKDENFIYKDNFKQSDSQLIKEFGLGEDTTNFLDNIYGTRSHSGWLSFMYPRLMLAKYLLKDDGVIFISIDDNELANIKLICDEIFNHTKVIVVKMSESSGLKMTSVQKNGSIPKLKEYIVIASKTKIQNINLDPIPKEEWDNEYSIFLENFSKSDKSLIDEFSLKEDLSENDIEKLDNLIKKIKLSSVSSILKSNGINKKDSKKWCFENSWRICRTAASDSVFKLCEQKKKSIDQIVFFVQSIRDKALYLVKSDYSEESSRPRVQLIFAQDNLTKHTGDLWLDIKTTGIDNEGGITFKNGKKPVELIKRVIKTKKAEEADTIIDFFAGSGTTAHAVMQQNAEDGGNRKFILCQLDEEIDHKKSKPAYDFCKENNFEPVISSITIERVNRAGDKIKAENPYKDIDIGYKVFSHTEKPRVDYDEKQKSFNIINQRAKTIDTLINMLVATCKPLDTKIETIKADAIYKADNEIYVVDKITADDLEPFKSLKINIDALADFNLKDYLNIDLAYQDNITMIY